MAYNVELADRVRRFLEAKRVPFETKSMMGGLCFMVNGKMCVGVADERLMVRLDPALCADALTRPGCLPMDFTGRPMRSFVFVSPEGTRTAPQLRSWVELALDFNPRAKPSKKRRPPPRRAR
jgi:TfoX/Sxy family transcriptional regulator of competence genes